jgi:hypothetical protein
MILPSKHLTTERSLLAIGADILSLLKEPKSVSKIWLDYLIIAFVAVRY